MSLLLPFFLGAAALIGVPILLHFLRRKPQVTVRFPSLQFLGASAVLETRRHRVRRWLTLLLRCLIILLVCLAFSRPFWNVSQAGHGRAMIVAVDNSFSMQTAGRWKMLQEWSLQKLAQLGPGDRAGLLLMNPSPRWLVPLTDQASRVRDTLAALTPGYEITRYDPALRMAGDALIHSGAHDRTLVWMADEQELGWNGVSFTTPLPAGVQLEFPPVSAPPARQAALTGAQWEGDSLRVEIRQYVPDQDTRQLTLSAGGKMLAQQKVELSAGKATSVTLPLGEIDPAKLQQVKVELDHDDLPVDDTLYLAPRSEDKTAILLTPFEAGADSFDFVRHAIDSTRAVAASPLQARDLPDREWPVGSVVIVRGSHAFQEPLAGRLDRFLQAGGVACLFLDGAPAEIDWMQRHHLAVAPVAVDSPDAPLHLRNWDMTHPLLQSLADSNLMGLLGIEFYQGFSIAGADATPLATWDDGKGAIDEVSENGSRFLVCGFAPTRDATDWPVHASFVPFIHSALLWLSRQQAHVGNWRVGDTIPLPAAGTWKSLDGPQPVSETQVRERVRPTAPGLYQFTPAFGPSQLFAVNLRPEESDPRLWPTPQDFAQLTAPGGHAPAAEIVTADLSREDAENQQRVWWWLLALVVLLLFGELRMANRTSM